MSEMMRKLKRIVSMVLSFTLLMGSVQVPAFAAGDPVYLPQNEITEEMLAGGAFYIATDDAGIPENAGVPYIFKVGRGGENLPEAEVRLDMVDLTAKYGVDYKIKLHDSSLFGEKVKNTSESTSVLEQISKDVAQEENFTDIIVATEGMRPEEIENLYNEDMAYMDAYLTENLEGYEENKNAYFESLATEETGEEEKPAANSLKGAKELATGLKSDKTPMDGGDAPPVNFVEQMLSEMALTLESAYLLLSFKEGETEKFIEIIPINNKIGDGDRTFSINLHAVSQSTCIGQSSGMNVSIIDDEEQAPATVSFTEERYYPAEGYIKVTIERTGAINQMVSVNVKTEDITAAYGRDYSMVNTAVAFPYGITKRTINIPVRSEYIDEDVEFKMVMSDAVNCNMGAIDTAYGVIMADSESFRVLSASNEGGAGDASRPDANVSSYFTDEALDIQRKFYYYITDHARLYSYATATDDGVEIYTQSASSGAVSTVSWYIREHYDISGLEIDWTKESGMPCYTDTRVFGENERYAELIWDSEEERWERKISKAYFTYDMVNEFKIEQERSLGWLGKSPTLKVHAVKPILRPFVITLKGAEPIKFLNENGEYADNTTMSSVADANNALLRNATNTGTGSVVKFSGDTFTVTSNSKYSYIKGLKIVNNDTGESKVLRDNLAPGTTSVSVKLDNNFIKDNLAYIVFSDNEKIGRKGAFSIQPIMGYYETHVKIHKDYRGEIRYNGTPAVKEEADGIVLTYHKGDKIRFTQSLYQEYQALYTGSRIRIVTKDDSTATPLDNKLAYEKNTNYCTILNSYAKIDVYPNFDKKDNQIIVRVKRSDLGKFDLNTGIFSSQGVKSGLYMEYTVVDSDNFAEGVYYELVAKAKKTGYTPVWQKIHTDVKYSQSTFYYESKSEIEENIIYLTCQKADDTEYALTGNAYYSDVALNGGKEGSAWMPASGVYVVIGADKYGISDDEGNFDTIGMYGVNGMDVIYKTIASGKTEYKTVTLHNDKMTVVGGTDMEKTVYDVGIGTIKAAVSDASSPYVTAVVATNSANVENGYISINDQATLFTVAISNNGAEYIDTDGVRRMEKVQAVDFLVYDGFTHQLKTEITGARQVSDVNGISIWSHSVTFQKGQAVDYAASDALYVRLTTDKVIGNGKGYDVNGELVEIESMKETIYAPVNTGYTFEEANRLEPVTHDVRFDIDTNFIQLPIIGTMDGTFNFTRFSMTISTLPNGGQRLALGRIFRFDQYADTENLPDDGGVPDDKNPGKFKPYSVKNLSQLGEGVKNFGEKLKDKGSMGMRRWAIGLIGGIYLDFGIKKVQHTEEVAHKFVLIGGGLYGGGMGRIRLVIYFATLFGLPVYAGAEGEVTIFGQAGITAINEDTVTADSIAADDNAFESQLKVSGLVQANASVSVYAGLGLCGTLGVRGGFYFYGSLLYYPSITLVYPQYRDVGAIVSYNFRFWVDLLLFTAPITAIGDELKFGYFEDVENSEKEERDILSSGDEKESNVVMKERNSIHSKWMPEENDRPLQSTFAPDTSTVLVENGYDRADPQLLDLGDGRIMLAFIADDPERSDEERTALMYSIYDNGLWSAPVKVQDDGTADFEPDLCDAGDKVHITWTSREPGLGYTSETEYLKTIDVYTTTIDKSTLAIGNIERLTDDAFYDSAPIGMYDEVSGDYIVYYLKSAVGDDFLTTMSPTTNESVIVYMLYDAKEGKWARDYYYDNEVASEEAEDILVKQWGGQRFLSSPIQDFGMSDPIIIDFDAISYNSLGVYTYTVDEDNNVDTVEDRELFIQVYDFEEHATYAPIRITKDNIADARPQLVRNGEHTYLFWLQNNKDIRYINISELIKEGVNDDGTIKENYDVVAGFVSFSLSNGSDMNPTFGSYQAFVDKDDNLFITWLQPVTNEDGSSNQEIFASALVSKGYENVSWSEGVRLTHSGEFHDEVAFVTDANGDLLTVSNQYAMDLKAEGEGVDHVKLVATKFKTVGSLEICDVTYANDAPQAGSKVSVTAQIKNAGLKTAKGYTLKVYEKINGATGNEVFSVVSNEEIAPSVSEHVTFDWTMPESFENVHDLSLYMEIQEAETEEVESYASENINLSPVYKIVAWSVEERGDAFYATYTVENVGNTDAEGREDKVVVKFHDLYQENAEVKPYLEAPIGDLKVNEMKTFVKPLTIGADRFEYGYTNASIGVVGKDEKLLSDYENMMIVLEHPYDIAINGDKDITEIHLKEGERLALDIDFSPCDFYQDAAFNYEMKDASVASVKDDKLVANRYGETEMTIMVVPYGGEKTVKVVVEKKKTSSGGSGIAKCIVTFDTNGGNPMDSMKINRNSVIGEIENPVKDGFVFEGWYLDEALTKKADLNAKITSDVTLYAKWLAKQDEAEWKNPFVDVKSNDWFYESVKYANVNGLFGGTAKDMFSPNEDLTRAMLVTVLYRAEGEPKTDKTNKFKDVLEDAYYADAVSWAQENGMISGVSQDEFAPSRKITREQIATIMYRYAVYKGMETVTLEENLGFFDAGDISEYAVSAMNRMVGLGIMKGYEDNTIKPKNNATRAEATTVLQRFFEKVQSIENN